MPKAGAMATPGHPAQSGHLAPGGSWLPIMCVERLYKACAFRCLRHRASLRLLKPLFSTFDDSPLSAFSSESLKPPHSMRTIVYCLFVALTGLLSPARAALMVANTTDAGAGSLRQALAAAAPGETIVITATGTLTLTTGELLINKDLTLIGPGPDKLTIQRANGAPLGRILRLDTGIVSISGLTIKNGAATVGAGIQNETTLALSNCFVIGNVASQSGGGINNQSSIAMNNCVVQGNSVSGTAAGSKGGGINNEGTIAAVNCL